MILLIVDYYHQEKLYFKEKYFSRINALKEKMAQQDFSLEKVGEIHQRQSKL